MSATNNQPTDLEQILLDLIGSGMRLRIPHDKLFQSSAIVEGLAKYGKNRDSIPVSEGMAYVLAQRLHKLDEQRVDDRLGWREAGYDGEVADWYCLTF
jgi:hypothetical protein